jgi:hypothetical protein
MRVRSTRGLTLFPAALIIRGAKHGAEDERSREILGKGEAARCCKELDGGGDGEEGRTSPSLYGTLTSR